jgi:large subunit ribosomal protein L33
VPPTWRRKVHRPSFATESDNHHKSLTRSLRQTAKSRTIAVRLISMAMTGYYKTFVRPRQHRPLSMLKYDPVGTFPIQMSTEQGATSSTANNRLIHPHSQEAGSLPRGQTEMIESTIPIPGESQSYHALSHFSSVAIPVTCFLESWKSMGTALSLFSLLLS